jgi:HEPN domain-containing protein
MNETVREWVAKAEGDFRTAGREIEVEVGPNYDAVCYHAQQCIEKLMKALLIEHGVVPPRTHDLVQLDQLLTPLISAWSWPVEELRLLTRAAVEFRYPGESADKDEAAEAFEVCARLRAQLLPLFGP